MGILIKGLEMPKPDEQLVLRIDPTGKVTIDMDLQCKQVATAQDIAVEPIDVEPIRVSSRIDAELLARSGFPKKELPSRIVKALAQKLAEDLMDYVHIKTRKCLDSYVAEASVIVGIPEKKQRQFLHCPDDHFLETKISGTIDNY